MCRADLRPEKKYRRPLSGRTAGWRAARGPPRNLPPRPPRISPGWPDLAGLARTDPSARGKTGAQKRPFSTLFGPGGGIGIRKPRETPVYLIKA